jgi:phosphonate transport system ATP-binding protein
VQLALNNVTAGPDPRRPVFQRLNLALPQGAQVAIIGPSGAGKTTLLEVAGLALQPVAGAVLHGSEDPWRLSSRQRRQARMHCFLAPQLPPLPPRQRVVTAVLAGRLAAMGFWRSLRALIVPVDLLEVAEALAAFDLAEKLYERVDRLSGGERQRVGLARALISPADLWLLDEPLSSLDPARARQAISVLTASARARGATVLASFHQVELALEFFPRVLGLREGQLIYDGPPQGLSRPLLADLYAGDAERQ